MFSTLCSLNNAFYITLCIVHLKGHYFVFMCANGCRWCWTECVLTATIFSEVIWKWMLIWTRTSSLVINLSDKKFQFYLTEQSLNWISKETRSSVPTKVHIKNGADLMFQEIDFCNLLIKLWWIPISRH